MRKDPHLLLASNGVADLRGKDGGILNLLSASEFSLNALFEFSTFLLFDMKVHGSFIVGVFCVLRSSETRTVLKIEHTPNSPPSLLHGLPGDGPPKRLTVSLDLTFEDILIRHFKQANTEVLRIQTAAWVGLALFLGCASQIITPVMP